MMGVQAKIGDFRIFGGKEHPVKPIQHLKDRFLSMPLYRKIILVVLTVGMLPLAIILPFMFTNAVRQNTTAIGDNYRQMAEHLSYSVEDAVAVYDSITRLMYQYNGTATSDALYVNYENYDSLRKVIENAQEEGTSAEVRSFLRVIAGSDSRILETHLLVDSEDLGTADYHYEASGYFENLEDFKKAVFYASLDRESRNPILIPPHANTYSYMGTQNMVFTVARNYFDLRGAVGQEKYVGTLFLDVNVSRFADLLKATGAESDVDCYLVDRDNRCFYAKDAALLGTDLSDKFSDGGSQYLTFTSQENKYGLRAVIQVEKNAAYATLHSFILLSCWVILAVLAVLLVTTFVLSKSLSKPLSDMTREMKRVERGDFDISLKVTSRDEIGLLAENFNEMSRQLKNYINQSYVAKIRQNEAELTALKSQIYPHFLYNTLDVIRMSALENDDPKVATMIESLADQIRYLIAPSEDTVPLAKELDIIKKYVFLLNCRIEGKVDLEMEVDPDLAALIPRLTLQPIVENAYVHGIRPKAGSGSILISAEKEGDVLEIDVCDNGVGMNEQELQRLKELLAGDQPGIRNAYDWQSIGLKNVQDRLQIYYGPDFGLEVTSTPGVGTVVQIRMPYMTAEQADGKKTEG